MTWCDSAVTPRRECDCGDRIDLRQIVPDTRETFLARPERPPSRPAIGWIGRGGSGSATGSGNLRTVTPLTQSPSQYPNQSPTHDWAGQANVNNLHSPYSSPPSRIPDKGWVEGKCAHDSKPERQVRVKLGIDYGFSPPSSAFVLSRGCWLCLNGSSKHLSMYRDETAVGRDP